MSGREVRVARGTVRRAFTPHHHQPRVMPGMIVLMLVVMRSVSPPHTDAVSVHMLPAVKPPVTSAPFPTPQTIRLAVLAPANDSKPFSLNKTLPAIVYAAKNLEKRGISGPLAGRRVEILYRDTNCSSTTGPLAAFEFYNRGEADVFFGPLCPYVLAPVARYASAWNIPLMTAGGQNDIFDFREPHYRLLIRMNGSYTQIGFIFVQMLRKFRWSVVALLYHDFDDRIMGHSDCYFSVGPVFTGLGKRPFYKSFDETKPDVDYANILREVSKSARVIVMCASPETIRQILLTGEELGMTASGDYVFFNIELWTSRKPGSLRPWHRPHDSPETNLRARKAYESLLTISARVPETPEYKAFSKSVKRIARRRFHFHFGREEVNTYVTAFHDAVLLYALALNDTLSEGYSIKNGSIVTRNMWNRTFEGITGKVMIDENGDCDSDYSLLDMDPKTGFFEVVANYFGVTKQIVDVPGRVIHWAAGRTQPPSDVPACGFDGSRCQQEVFPQYAVLSGVLSALVIILSALSFFVYRHYKLEAELASMTWKVKWEDLITSSNVSSPRGHGGGNNCHLKLVESRQSLNRTSYSSETLHLSGAADRFNCGQLFARTAYYKGVVVAIKPINKTKIEINRPLLLELKRMKDLQHDHIVRFIGACVDPLPRSCLLTEYCPKGSLQDILENDEIKLDWMFRYSLMHDIVKGMAYLHSSEIKSHGNLKSSNCVVDSRFVLKITDFGLHSLRQCNRDDADNEDSYAHWRRKLWTAPELLRMLPPPPEGSQKGDVYSFAIIAQEIVARQGPFYLGSNGGNHGPKEIIQNVIDGQKPPFRPLLDDTMCDIELITVIQKCWAEDPFERPDFHCLKSIIRRLNKENERGNILDNLLSRMEQYANNLEALVEERTADYLEEKRKAEDLLYQLLPKSVASQLIRGQAVKAEAYESVTIYFSDIVGFTSLSAQSTPMEVVTLLNDLYTCFDSIIENYDVYKVETIGDAYMVVSGLPVRNGNLHAREIARVSLALLDAVKSFTIRHRPGEQLKLRIGIHSGTCVAGIVGLKMPRYCLFGDTVNTASRMESTGLPLKIHVSKQTKQILDTFMTFILELRGEVEMKGKGKMTTYWLLGEISDTRQADSGSADTEGKINGSSPLLGNDDEDDRFISSTKTDAVKITYECDSSSLKETML